MSVDVLDFDVDSGNACNRRKVFDFVANEVKGFPDGMTIDTRGHLWVACFGGGQVKNKFRYLQVLYI
jgi:sugar lactone lactonase YvrE